MREFSTVYASVSGNQVRADPCHVGLFALPLPSTTPITPLSDNFDCSTNELPSPSNTVVVPVVSSPGYAALGGATFTITGKNLLGGTGGSAAPYVPYFRLSLPGGSCANPDRKNVLPITLPTGSGLSAAGDFVIITDTVTTASFATWFQNFMAFEEDARLICISYDDVRYYYTGLKWKPVYGITDSTICTTGTYGSTIKTALTAIFPINDTWVLLQNAKTFPCGAPPYMTCYNTNSEGCCNSRIYNPFSQMCCATIALADSSAVQWKDAACPCTQNSDCAQTNTPLCCLNTKYPELTTTTAVSPNSIGTAYYGQCYNSTTHQCCNTGHRYDPGSQQCCSINGLQSLDIPCPCNNDTQCGVNFKCCYQTSPALQEVSTSALACSTYANFPSGTGVYIAQPCIGQCINTAYQVCCNGAACLKNTEYCCNSTCCNRYVGTCSTGLRAGSPGSWWNGNDYGVTFYQCSTIEQMNTIKAFWIFVLPTELMFVTFFGLAMCLAFAAKAKFTHEYSITERVLLVAGILTTLFCVPMFFAPIYKYGVVLVAVCLLSLIAAAYRVKWLNIMVIFFHVVAVVYLFDFVDGNYYLELNSNRNFTTGVPDTNTMGVLHAIKKMFPSPFLIGQTYNFVSQTWDNAWCTTYYNYFRFDPQIHDLQRFNNPYVVTFGYCSRAWATALYLFVAAAMDLEILQLILSILLFLYRFHKQHFVELIPIEVSPYGEQKLA